MRYMLDTNICIYIINNKPPKIINRFKKEYIGNIVISSITLAELKFGAYNSGNPSKNLSAITKFTSPIEVLEFNEVASDYFGQVKSHLKASGNMIGQFDMLISAHALQESCILITNNIKEFERVPNLIVENWI